MRNTIFPLIVLQIIFYAVAITSLIINLFRININNVPKYIKSFVSHLIDNGFMCETEREANLMSACPY